MMKRKSNAPAVSSGPRSATSTVLVNGIVLSADDLQIVHRSAAERALDSYSRGKADFADYFLAEINAELGCGATFTFDGDALDCANFSQVP